MRVTLGGETLVPSRIEYTGTRPPPEYQRTIVLPSRDRFRLDRPTLVTFIFGSEARDAAEFRIELGEIVLDGTRTRIPPLAFSREGQFAAYRRPKKPTAPPTDEF